VGYISIRGHGTGVGTGVADHARGRARQRPVRAWPVRQGIEHVAAFVLVTFKRRLARDLMQCSSGFDLGLASYEEVKLCLSELSTPRQKPSQVGSNDLGLGSKFSRVF
jgi:hypothetical protein